MLRPLRATRSLFSLAPRTRNRCAGLSDVPQAGRCGRATLPGKAPRCALIALLASLLALGGCRKPEPPPIPQQPDREVELRLAETLRIAPSRLTYQSPRGTLQDWTIDASLPREEPAWVITLGALPVMYFAAAASSEQVLVPPQHWFAPGKPLTEAQALRLARLNARRLWLRDAPQPTLQPTIGARGSWYTYVTVAMAGGNPPFPTVAEFCFNRKTGGVISLETRAWRDRPGGPDREGSR